MNKKITKVAVSILVTVSIVGGFMYSNQKAKARDATEKQALIESIDAQHDLEYQAKVAKENAPMVSEEYPAKIIPNSLAVPEEQQSLPPLKVAPTTATTLPTVQEAVPAKTALSDADIQSLQNYAQYSGNSAYISFENMYVDHRNSCDALMEKFSALTLRDYSKAKVEWITSPKLIYRNALALYCVRGIVTLTYYEAGNKFGLTPNVKYQREAEYQLRNSVTDGRMTLKLENIIYHSEFKAVK